MWEMSPKDLGEKVKLFFQKYAINRHKACTLTPSYLCEQYCPDDNRYGPTCHLLKCHPRYGDTDNI